MPQGKRRAPVMCYECSSHDAGDVCADPFNESEAAEHPLVRQEICNGPCAKWVQRPLDGELCLIAVGKIIRVTCIYCTAFRAKLLWCGHKCMSTRCMYAAMTSRRTCFRSTRTLCAHVQQQAGHQDAGVAGVHAGVAPRRR